MKLKISIVVMIITLFKISYASNNSEYIEEYLKKVNQWDYISNTTQTNTSLATFLNNIDNYNFMAINQNNTTHRLEIKLGNYITSYTDAQVAYNKNSSTGYYIIYYSNNSVQSQKGQIYFGSESGTSKSFNIQNGAFIGPLYSSNGIYYGLDNTNTFSWNKIETNITQGYIDNTIDNTFKIAESTIGINYQIENVTYKLFKYDSLDAENYELYEEVGTLEKEIDTSSEEQNIYNIYCNKQNISETHDYIIGNYYNNNLINYSNGAYIVVEQEENNTPIIYISGDSGAITNKSGEIISNIDLGPIEERQNKTNELLNEINNTLISGEKAEEERHNFWTNFVNTMFEPSEEYIENKIEELKEELTISGEHEEITMVLENIKNNSGDFIIAWEDFTPHFSIQNQQIENVKLISKGQINFSQLERENETFQDVMRWVRIIIGFSLSVILIKNGWNLILKTLGISTNIYESEKDEKERLERVDKK